MNNFLQEFEALRKEVWYLKNKTIKNLIEEVALLTGGELDSTLIERLGSLESVVSALENNIKSLEVEVDNNSDSIGDISQHVSELSGVILAIKESVAGINREIEALKSTDELLSGNINTLSDNLAKVEQDLGDLAERVDGLSGGVDLSALLEEIQTLKSNDAEQDFNIGGLTATQADNIKWLNNHQAYIGTLQKEMDVAQSDIEKLQSDVEEIKASGSGSSDNSELQEQIDLHEQEIENIKAEQTQLKASVEVNSSSISSLQESDAEQEEDISNLNETASNLSSSLSNVQSLANSNSQTLATLQEELAQMKTKLDNVKATQVDVLYDMRSEDSAVNLGYTSGITGYTLIDMDLTGYSKIKVFCTLNSCDVQKEMDLINREKYDITLIACNTGAKVFYFYKIIVPTNKLRFQTYGYATWTWSATNSALSVETGKTNEKIYVYRIEGIKDL